MCFKSVMMFERQAEARLLVKYTQKIKVLLEKVYFVYGLYVVIESRYVAVPTYAESCNCLISHGVLLADNK